MPLGTVLNNNLLRQLQSRKRMYGEKINEISIVYVGRY
jgi:hypothetical protein